MLRLCMSSHPSMEILLLQDITGIGKKNDLLVVGDGFALNYLLPERMGLVATPTVRKRYAEQIRRRALEREQERQQKMQSSQLLAGKSVIFTKKATKTGKLYAGITATAIAAALKDQHGIAVAPDAIDLPEPIKMIGTHSVQIKIFDQTQTVLVVINAEKSYAILGDGQ